MRASPSQEPSGPSRSGGLEIGYSTNVHRGETLDDVRAFLRDYTVPIARRVFGRRPAGLELRFGKRAVAALSREAERRRFGELLASSGLELFSINAFPIKDFQARRVKENVYAPDWTTRDRVETTGRIARILAALLPPDTEGSISTLAGSYRPWGHGRRVLDRIARGYLEVLETLDAIEESGGPSIVLAVEPEPDTTLELAADVIGFVEGHLLPAARRLWRRHGAPAAIEARVRRRFTVNLDTCHFSVLFHSPADAVRELAAAGIAIGKLHVTNALALPRPCASPGGYAALRGMDEPRYLHQFCGVDARGRSIWRGRDLGALPPRLDPEEHAELAELRTHFHVPLYLKRWRSLRTTQDETRAALRAVLAAGACRHIVLETYTWPVLATEDRLLDGITREFRWLLGEIEAVG